MDKIEAELQAKIEAAEQEAHRRKDEVLDDPVELFQSLQPNGMALNSHEKKLYYLLGVMTKEIMAASPAPQLSDEAIGSVNHIAAFIENAVEEYIENDEGCKL